MQSNMLNSFYFVYLYVGKIWCSGYMSPEYAINGLFSVKSDVYSFGVMMLEILSGKRNILSFHYSNRSMNLLGYVSNNNRI